MSDPRQALTFDLEGGDRFTLRAAAIARRGERVLLCTDATSKFWYLPGGRPRYGESTRAAVAREVQEELGTRAVVGPLSIIIENFFGDAKGAHHEVGLYYAVDLPALGGAEEVVGREQDAGAEGIDLTLRWTHLDDLAGLDLRPRALKTLLEEVDAGGPRHVVQQDPARA